MKRNRGITVPLENMRLLDNDKTESATSKQREDLINKYKGMGIDTSKLTKK